MTVPISSVNHRTANFPALSLLFSSAPIGYRLYHIPLGDTRDPAPLAPLPGGQAAGGAGSGVQRHGSREVHEPTDRDAVSALAIDDAAGIGIVQPRMAEQGANRRQADRLPPDRPRESDRAAGIPPAAEHSQPDLPWHVAPEPPSTRPGPPPRGGSRHAGWSPIFYHEGSGTEPGRAHADDRTGARWFELDPAMPTAGTEPLVATWRAREYGLVGTGCGG